MITLKKGSKGEEVKELQQRLNAFSFELEVDGDFGSATHDAVYTFQRCTKLAADGICGAKTWAMLERIEALAKSDGTAAGDLCARAFSQLGYAEPNGDDKYIAAYNAQTGAGFSMSVAWCQMFVWWLLTFHGIVQPQTASCTQAMNWYKEHEQWSEEPARGRLVYFDWDNSGDCDHVGVVVDVSDTEIFTVEGNASGAGYDAVSFKSYSRNSNKIRGYADPLKTKEKETDKPEYPFYIVGFADKAAAVSFAKSIGAEVMEITEE